MKTIGKCRPASLKYASRSTPLMPSKCTSSTRQFSVHEGCVSRNCSVVGNETTRRPAARSKRPSDFSTDASSSITPMSGGSARSVSSWRSYSKGPILAPRGDRATLLSKSPSANVTLGQRHAASLGRTRRRGREPETIRHPDEISHRTGLHFLHDASAVDLDRPLARAQPPGDLLVQHARDHQRKDLVLAWREPRLPRRQQGHECIEALHVHIERESALDRRQQLVFIDGLGEEIHGADLHGAHAR